MAVKQLVVSDLSGEEVSDNTHARVQVRHPDNPSILELDVSTEEAGKLVNTTLRLVEFTIYEPNKPPRTALVETKTLDTIFKGVDFDKVLEGARKVSAPAAAAGARKRAASPAKAAGERLDYTTPENAGKLHRGRVTEAEAEWVKANQAAASYNREQQTGKPIDFDDETEKKRYGIA